MSFYEEIIECKYSVKEKDIDIQEFENKIFKNIIIEKDRLIFVLENNNIYIQEHRQDCCEDVEIEDICGDIYDLINTPILFAEVVSKHDYDIKKEDLDYYTEDESYTWTFYKLATNKGSVTIRWYGTSNGYYSEEVEINYYEKQETK